MSYITESNNNITVINNIGIPRKVRDRNVKTDHSEPTTFHTSLAWIDMAKLIDMATGELAG